MYRIVVGGRTSTYDSAQMRCSLFTDVKYGYKSGWSRLWSGYIALIHALDSSLSTITSSHCPKTTTMSSSNTSSVAQDAAHVGAWANEAIECCNNTPSSSRPDGMVLKPAAGLWAITAKDPAVIIADFKPQTTNTDKESGTKDMPCEYEASKPIQILPHTDKDLERPLAYCWKSEGICSGGIGGVAACCVSSRSRGAVT